MHNCTKHNYFVPITACLLQLHDACTIVLSMCAAIGRVATPTTTLTGAALDVQSVPTPTLSTAGVVSGPSTVVDTQVPSTAQAPAATV